MIVDRIEGTFVIVELDKCKFVEIPKEVCPDGISEGDVIEIKIVKTKETKNRKDKISNKLNDLFNNK